MEITPLLLVATFFVALLSSILSGIASGGGGFIMGPWELMIGFSPAQMIATGSVGGSSIGLGSLMAMRRNQVRVNHKLVYILGVSAAITSFIASYIVPHISPDLFKGLTALLTICSLPLFFSRHHRLMAGERNRASRVMGYCIVSLLLFGCAVVFSSLFGLLLAIALPFFFGTSTMESTAIRRVLLLTQSVILVTMMFGHILWPFTIATTLGGYIGSYIGTHIAIRQGEVFARRALAIGAILSTVSLLFTI